jgi:hypothetical protein
MKVNMNISKSLRTISLFEEAVYRVFSTKPIPATPKNMGSDFQSQAWVLLNDRPWSEVVGLRLYEGGLDLHFIAWVKYLPLDVVKYYLPSHLIMASILIYYNVESNHPIDLVEALILPPSKDAKLLADMDSELSLASRLEYEGESRLDLYKAMNPEERTCIAYFLDIYAEFKWEEFTERGLELFKKNTEYWRSSNLDTQDW